MSTSAPPRASAPGSRQIAGKARRAQRQIVHGAFQKVAGKRGFREARRVAARRRASCANASPAARGSRRSRPLPVWSERSRRARGPPDSASRRRRSLPLPFARRRGLRMPSCAAHISAGYVQISASVGCRCGMRMKSSTVASIVHRDDHFVDQLGALWTDDRRAENAAALGVGHHLHEAFRLRQTLRLAVFGEIVASDDVARSRRSRRSFSLAPTAATCGIGEDRVRRHEPVVGRFGAPASKRCAPRFRLDRSRRGRACTRR